jgi:O-antigen/teichoic acid export membrane protein
MVEPRRSIFSALKRSESGGLVRDSAALGVSSLITIAGYAAQTALISHILGLSALGTFSIVVAVVSVVGQIFYVRAGDIAVVFGSQNLPDRPPTVLGIIQLSYVIDAVAGGVAALTLVLVGALVGVWLAGPDGPQLIAIYGLSLAIASMQNTSLSVLRLFGHFGAIPLLTVVREALRVGLVAAALLQFESLTALVLSLLLVELGFGLVCLAAAMVYSRRHLSLHLLQSYLPAARHLRRPILRMSIQANMISYAKLAWSQAPTLILGAFRPSAEVGAFKVATAIAGVAGKPADPAVGAILPRFARLWAADRHADIRRLVIVAALAIFALTLCLGALVYLFRVPLLTLIGSAEAADADTVLALALANQLIAAVFFWNTPLLFAEGAAGAAARGYLIGSGVLLPALFLLIPAFGATGAVTAMIAANLLANVILTVAAWRRLPADPPRESLEQQRAGVEAARRAHLP